MLARAIAACWSAFAFVIGFPLGFLLSLALMKGMVPPRHRQAKLTSRGSDDFLAASAGMDWVHPGGDRFARIPLRFGRCRRPRRSVKRKGRAGSGRPIPA